MSHSVPKIYDFNAVRLLDHLDVDRLEKDVDQVVEHCEWIERDIKKWHAIPLRSYHGGTTAQHVQHNGVHNYSMATEFKDTVHMQYCPYIKELIDSFDAPVYKVRLMKMDAKSQLPKHTDIFYTATTCRLHIAVKTNSLVTMTIDKKQFHLEQGSIYFANVRKIHSVENASDEDRIHVVFDIEWCDKLQQLLEIALKNQLENIV